MRNNVKAVRETRGKGAGTRGTVARGHTPGRRRGRAAAKARTRRDLTNERLVIARGCRALAAGARQRGAPGDHESDNHLRGAHLAAGAVPRPDGERAPGCTAVSRRPVGDVLREGRSAEFRLVKPAKGGGSAESDGLVRVDGSAGGRDSAESGEPPVPSDPAEPARVGAGTGRRKAKGRGRKRRNRRSVEGRAPVSGPRNSAPTGVRKAGDGAAVVAGAEKPKTGPLPVDGESGAGLARAGAELARARRRAEVLARQRSTVDGGADFSRYHRRDAARRELMRRRIRWTLRQATKEVRGRGDLGMATAEYAVALLAAVGLATVLYKVVTGGAVQSALQAAVMKALRG